MAPVRTLHTVDGFHPAAKQLRAVFDQRFADPRGIAPDRFVWDMWHVPGQYTALRTPAYHYFPAPLWNDLEQHLVAFGRKTLGCHGISAAWLSCYVEGCEQLLHGDVPHGPFAFVYSLTPWERRVFTGGHTQLLRTEVLDWWHHVESNAAVVEQAQLVQQVAPKFNRLTVFDPRIPHGVERVAGTMDPRQGRLVIHGWFLQPQPFVVGPLPSRQMAAAVGRIAGQLAPLLEGGLAVTGVCSVGFSVDVTGAVSQVKLLADTTRVSAPAEPQRRALVRKVLSAVRSQRFAAQRGASHVTLPLVFDR